MSANNTCIIYCTVVHWTDSKGKGIVLLEEKKYFKITYDGLFRFFLVSYKVFVIFRPKTECRQSSWFLVKYACHNSCKGKFLFHISLWAWQIFCRLFRFPVGSKHTKRLSLKCSQPHSNFNSLPLINCVNVVKVINKYF